MACVYCVEWSEPYLLSSPPWLSPQSFFILEREILPVPVIPILGRFLRKNKKRFSASVVIGVVGLELDKIQWSMLYVNPKDPEAFMEFISEQSELVRNAIISQYV